MPPRARVAGILAVLLLAAGDLFAQSLAEVARVEAERRKTVKSAGKVYTNDSLRNEPAPVAPPPASGPTQQPAATAPAVVPPSSSGGQAQAGSQAAGQAPPAPQSQQDETKTEAYWRKRMASAREALSRAQIFAEALQTRINALSADFVNRDDPAQRELIATDRQKALAELERVRLEIQEQQKAIADIQTDARRTGIPAGWVR